MNIRLWIPKRKCQKLNLEGISLHWCNIINQHELQRILPPSLFSTRIHISTCIYVYCRVHAWCVQILNPICRIKCFCDSFSLYFRIRSIILNHYTNNKCCHNFAVDNNSYFAKANTLLIIKQKLMKLNIVPVYGQRVTTTERLPVLALR